MGNTNDLDHAATEDERIRAKAHEIWICEGCPEGRSHIHWEMAASLVRMTPPATPAADTSQASSAVMIAFRTARAAKLAAAAARAATPRRRGKPRIVAAE